MCQLEKKLKSKRNEIKDQAKINCPFKNTKILENKTRKRVKSHFIFVSY